MEPVWITVAVIEWFVIMWLGYRLRDVMAELAEAKQRFAKAIDGWATDTYKLSTELDSLRTSGMYQIQSTPQPYTFTGIPEAEQHLNDSTTYGDYEGPTAETDRLEQVSRYTYTGGVVDESIPNE